MERFTSKKVVVPVILIGIVVFTGVVFLVQKESEQVSRPTPTPETTVEAPDDWVTYRSEELGIEFEYPGEYLEDEKLANRCGPRGSSDSLVVETLISLNFMDLWGMTLAEYINQFDGTEDSPYPYIWITNEESTAEKILIPGTLEAMKITHQINPWYIGSSHRLFKRPPQGATVFAKINDSRILVIRTHDGIEACGIEGKNTFEKILSTLKIQT
jgi:hypothetical protein